MNQSDGMESDDNDKDQYQPEDADLVQEGSDEDEAESEDSDEGEVESVESKDEVDSEKEEVVSKKGKKAKAGRREIAAIRTTVPTTGSKSAVEHAKRRSERSPRSVPLNLYVYHLH